MQVRNLVCAHVLCGALLAAAPPELLKIVVVEGQGAINNIRERSAHAPVVRIEDENGRPVAGAHVTFTLPELGAGGAFSNGQTFLSTVTDKNGRATGFGLRPNNVAGRFLIQVGASSEGATAHTTIAQTNAAPAAAKKGSTKFIVIAGLAVGAVAGAVFAAKGGGGGSGSTTGNSGGVGGPGGTTVTPGSPVFGPPR